jgi:hypothetical protein
MASIGVDSGTSPLGYAKLIPETRRKQISCDAALSVGINTRSFQRRKVRTMIDVKYFAIEQQRWYGFNARIFRFGYSIWCFAKMNDFHFIRTSI